MNDVNVGVIGFGVMGRIRLDSIKSTGGKYRVTSICDTNPERDMHLQDIEFTANYDEVLEDKKIALVFVCTPNYLNKEITVKALDSGKHVFCEKPPGVNLGELREIVEAEKRNPHLKLMFGFNHRHHDSIIHAKKLVDSKKYGDILWMRGRYGKSVNRDFYDTWRARKETAGGGILLDQGIHMLDLFLMMCGYFEEVHAFVSDLYWHLDGVEDNVFAILRNKKGQVASLHSTMTQWRHLFSFEIFLERGTIVVNGLLTTSGSYGQEVLSVAKNRTSSPAATWTKHEERTYTINSSWEREVRTFLDAIEEDAEIPVGNSQDALKVMTLVERIYAQR